VLTALRDQPDMVEIEALARHLGRHPNTLRDHLRALRGEGKCLLFSSHVLQEVAALCDRIVVLAHGSVVAVGTEAELVARDGAGNLEDALIALVGSPEGLAA
jgi:sodium transport system ATP-binding protein